MTFMASQHKFNLFFMVSKIVEKLFVAKVITTLNRSPSQMKDNTGKDHSYI